MYFSIENYQEALTDAKAAKKFQPTYIKAVEIGNVNTFVRTFKFVKYVQLDCKKS